MSETGDRVRGGLVSTANAELADYSSADHTFSEVPRCVDVYLGANTTATLRYKLVGTGDTIHSLPLTGNLYTYPAAMTAVVRSGTTAGLSVVGRW